jgi:hypothetical protein
MEAFKKLSESETAQAALWAVAFTGVVVLVALGRVKPETLEFMLFALVGRASVGKEKQ